MKRIRAKMVRNDDELLRNDIRRIALVSISLDKNGGAILLKGVSDTANAGSSRPAETSGVVTIDCDGPTME